MSTIKKISYRQYMMKQINRNDPIGDLARDMRDDKIHRYRTLEAWKKYLKTVACDRAYQAFKESQIEYLSV